MAIMLTCACGRSLRVPNLSPGVRVKCPVCAAILTPPEPQVTPPEEQSPPPEAPNPVQHSTDDIERNGYALEPVEKPTDSPRKHRSRASADEADGEPRRRSSRRTRRRSGKKEVQRKVYLIGGTLAILVGVAFILGVTINDKPGAGKVMVGGGLLAIFGVVSVIQALTDTMPDDDDF